MYIISYAKYLMMLVRVLLFLHLGQNAFQVGVQGEWKSLFPIKVVELEPLVVVARQSDSPVVHLSAVDRVIATCRPN